MGHSLSVLGSNPPPQVFILFGLDSLMLSLAKITDCLCTVLQKSIGNHRKRRNLFLSVGQFYQLFSVSKQVGELFELLDYLQKIGF